MFIRTEKSIAEFIRFYPVVFTIAVINIILWIPTAIPTLSLGHFIYDNGVGHNLSVLLLHQYWRLVTPIFLHADFAHVIFNTFALILFGPALEKMVGKLRFILIYLGAGIIGNIGTFFMDIHSYIPHLGASGSIYGLFGIYIYMVFFRKDLINSADSQLIKTIFVLGLVMSFIRPNINISAHVFGFIGGFAFGPIFLRKVASIYNRPSSSSGIYKENPFQREKAKKLFTHLDKKKIIIIILALLVIIGFIDRFF